MDTPEPAKAAGAPPETHETAPRSPLPIVPAESREPDLDLDVEECEGDRRYGREDIADK